MTRALKDSAARFLRESDFEKAAQVLEKLVRSDPLDMQHRLRLGDCYRRLAQTAKAIVQYAAVGRYYADEDQFIKAIAAFKVILEIDPGNAEAREQLARMNDRRVSRPGVELARVAPVRVPASVPNEEPPDYGRELVFDEDSESFSTGKRTKDVVAPPAQVKPPAQVPALQTVRDAPDIDQVDLPRLPTDAILRPGPEPEGPLARSIADLLSSDAEEEVESLSRSHDEPITGEVGATTAELIDDAVSAIASTTGKRHKLPTRVPLFDDLPRDAFVDLVNRLSRRRFHAGERILTEGEQGQSFFVIVEGKVRIWKGAADDSELQLATLEEGAFFGEMALLSGAPRTANVSAEVDTELLEVGDSVLRELNRRHPRIAQSLKNFYRRRLLDNVIAISPLFKDFEPAERRQIVERFRLRQAAPGEMLIKEGAAADGLYVVLHGSVEVTAKKIPVATLKEGDIFGEISLLTRQPATATVTSRANSILLRLAKDRFLELVVTHPQILALVSELTEERTAATRAALERHSISSFV